MLKRGAASAQDPGARGAEPGPRSGSRTRGGGRGGVCGGGMGAGRARAQGGRGRSAGRALAARVSHTRRFGRRRQRQQQAPPGRARARGLGRAPAASSLPRRLLARSLSGPLASRPGAELATAFSGRKKWGPRTPTSSSSTGNPGQGGGCGSDGAGARSVAERTARASEEGGARAFSYLWGRVRIP